MELKIEYIAVDDLKPYEKNNKKHEDFDIGEIAKSISKYEMIDPVGIWGRDNTIVEGHGRVLACKQLGINKVPCIRLDHLTDEQRREYAIVHNKSQELALYDFDNLADELADLDLSVFDFDFGIDADAEEETEIVEDEALTTEEDDIPDVEEDIEPITKKGDVWQLGNHRLVCGDSTDAETVKKLMNGKVADCVFTDPPYGMKKECDGVLNDNLNYDDLLEFNKKWIPLTFEHLKDMGGWYCWGIDEPLMDIYSHIVKPMAKDNKVTFRNLITWDKGNGQGQLSADFRMYPVADEKCLFLMFGEQDMRFKRNLEEFNEMFEPIRKWFEQEKKKSGLSVEQISKIDSTRCSHYWAKVQFEFPTKEAFCKIQNYCVENGINAFGVEYEEIKKEYEEIKKEFYENRAYFDNTHDNMNNVWHFDRTSVSERELTGGHATPKPIALCSRAIKTSSRENEIVLDVFGGSGSTLIACEQTDRICYMLELSEKYCDVIIKRWETLTGEKAVKLN